MTSMTAFRQSLVSPADRADIVDALRRFAEGQDRRDPELFRSAFTPDARLDFREPAGRFNVDLPVFEGRDVITANVLGSTQPLITTHSVTNERIVGFSAETAMLHALIEAQHVLRIDQTKRLLLKNMLTITLRTVHEGWGIEVLQFANSWFEGDPDVLFPGTSMRQG